MEGMIPNVKSYSKPAPVYRFDIVTDFLFIILSLATDGGYVYMLEENPQDPNTVSKERVEGWGSGIVHRSKIRSFS